MERVRRGSWVVDETPPTVGERREFGQRLPPVFRKQGLDQTQGGEQQAGTWAYLL